MGGGGGYPHSGFGSGFPVKWLPLPARLYYLANGPDTGFGNFSVTVTASLVAETMRKTTIPSVVWVTPLGYGDDFIDLGGVWLTMGEFHVDGEAANTAVGFFTQHTGT